MKNVFFMTEKFAMTAVNAIAATLTLTKFATIAENASKEATMNSTA